MSTKDKNILDAGGKYPFKVSDEYFDNLAARIMEQIPEENQAPQADNARTETKVIDINAHRNRQNMWIKALSIAACFTLVVLLSIKFFPTLSSEEEATAEMTAQEYTDDDYNEDLMYYSMADYGDVYSYLSGAE